MVCFLVENSLHEISGRSCLKDARQSVVFRFCHMYAFLQTVLIIIAFYFQKRFSLQCSQNLLARMISYQWIRQELPVSHGCPAKEQIDVVCLKNARQSAAHLIQALLQTDVLYLIDAQRKKNRVSEKCQSEYACSKETCFKRLLERGYPWVPFCLL